MSNKPFEEEEIKILSIVLTMILQKKCVDTWVILEI